MGRDWHAWHTEYDDPSSSLSKRLEVVREQLRDLLTEHDGPVRAISMCSGDGRDLLPVLARTSPQAQALLVELDRQLCDGAVRAAAALGLGRVVVRTADAGTTDAYRDATPADVVLACGVFGNITDEDLARTVRGLPMLLAPAGVVIWTRGCVVPDDPSNRAADPSEHVRHLFAEAGFEELAYIRPDDAAFRVGVHRLARPPETLVPGVRLFTFV
jgi:hypothetical protein